MKTRCLLLLMAAVLVCLSLPAAADPGGEICSWTVSKDPVRGNCIGVISCPSGCADTYLSATAGCTGWTFVGGDCGTGGPPLDE